MILVTDLRICIIVHITPRVAGGKTLGDYCNYSLRI